MLMAVWTMQGIVTSDVSGLAEPGSKPVYAALLTAQGRFLHDLFLHTDSSAHLCCDTALQTEPGLLCCHKGASLP